MSLYLNMTKDFEVVDILKIYNPTSLFGRISSRSDKKVQQSYCFLTFNSVNKSDPYGSSIFVFNDTNIIDLDVKRRKENEIKNGKDKVLKEDSNEYTSATYTNRNLNDSYHLHL